LTLQFVYDSVEQGNTVIRLTEGIQSLPAVAHGGEVSFAGVTIEDPNGTLDFKAWQPVYFQETACTGRTRIWTGYVAARAISRGKYRNGAGRIWDMTLVDQNAVFSLLAITGNDWNRPAETDIVRLAALTGSIYLPSSLIGENGKADFTNDPVGFGESDYRHQFPLDVFTSVAGTSGKDFYAYYDHTAGETSLFYDLNATTLGLSTLRISNVAADYDGTTTFAPLKDAVLTRSGEDVYSNIDYQYRGGFVVDQDDQTITDFIKRSAVYSTDRVGRRETAVALAAAFLDAHDEETDEIAFSVRLPKAKVNLIEQGMGLEVKFSHLPGYSSGFTETKLISRNVRQYDDEWYDLDLVGSLKPLISGPGGGGVVILPHRPCGATTGDYVQHVDGAPGGVPASLTLPAAPTAGNTLIVFGQVRNAGQSPNTPDGFTQIGSIVTPHETDGGAWYRHVQAGDSATITWPAGSGGIQPPELAYVGEYLGQLEVESATLVSTDPYNTNSPFPGAAITPTSGVPGAILGYWFAKRDHGALAADTGWTLRDAQTAGSVITHAVIEKDVSSTSGTYTPSFTGANPAAHDNHSYGAITVALLCAGSDSPPLVGQWVYDETATPPTGGGNRIFFTANPYADGSLRVFVDDVDQTLSATESDPATGEFTLAFDPTSTETVTTNYQGR
jgi:hypothetical protein